MSLENVNIENQVEVVTILIVLTYFFIFKFYFEKKRKHFLFVISMIYLLIVSFLYFYTVFELQQVLITIFLVSVNDISAYFGGKKFGKTKIFPQISPNKSLEGTVIGIISTIIVSIIFCSIIGKNYFNYFWFGFSISCLGLIGDLFISKFKRKLLIKDISQIIPGHGGLLDRLDSYLFCIPLSIIFFELT